MSPTSNVGIGDTSPSALLTVGDGDLFQVTSAGYVRSIDGAVGTPTYSFTGDTDTGIWLNSTGALSFSDDGIEVLRVASTSLDLTLNDTWFRGKTMPVMIM